MQIIYNVTLKPTANANTFQVSWHNPETGDVTPFDQTAEITQQETQKLWQMPQFQTRIGQKLFRFLDGPNQLLRQALEKAHRKGEILQLHLHTCDKTHDWPFELLNQHDTGTFLLPHRIHLIRNVSAKTEGIKKDPQDRPLKLLFMACSALDVKPELDFEREEEAIFKITQNLPIHIDVEDSGSLEGLRTRLEKEHYDVIHLSGHTGITSSGRPYFIMEDETGFQHHVLPYKLWNEALMENPPRLLFLSGSHTGNTPRRPDGGGLVSFARLLARNYKIPAVLEWGRYVNDQQSIHAGKMIFHGISRGKSILHSIQRARYELITRFASASKPAWSMLRLFSSGMELNPIVKPNQQWQPKTHTLKHVYLSNSEVKILAHGFVGRRRQLQTGLRALKQDNDKIGVLLAGTGGLGKSCLAGKLCERFKHHTLIVVHGVFNTPTLAYALEEAFFNAGDQQGRQILAQEIEMKDKLAKLCTTGFRDKKYIILLDDFEQNLEGGRQGRPGSVIPEAAQLLDVLLHDLPFSEKMTQVIITCRYKFPLTIRGENLIEKNLENVWLTSFRQPEQLKKLHTLPHIFNYKDPKADAGQASDAVPRLLAAGHGNPRLMEWIDVLVGQMDSAQVPQLLAAVKDKQEEFIRKHVIRQLLQRGGKQMELFLRWFSIYRRPVLKDGVRLVSKKAGFTSWEPLLKKGMALSLAEHDQVRRSYQVTPLLREELLNGLPKHHPCHEAAFFYYQKACDVRNSIDPVITEEFIFHAMGCGEDQLATHQGEELLSHLHDGLAYLEAGRVGEWILAEKKAKNRELSTANDAALLNILGLTTNNLSDYHKAIAYFQQALDLWKKVSGETDQNIAGTLNNLGGAYSTLGGHRKAIDYYQQALDILKTVCEKTPPQVATTLNNLGTAWTHLGEHQKAIAYYQQALESHEAISGEKHPFLAFDLNNLGASYCTLGDYPKAIDYYQQALDIMTELYGETHPQVATALNNMGTTWAALGNHQKAIAYFQQALDVDEKIFGKKHPDIAIDLNNLGGTWRVLGEPRKAIHYFQQTLDIFTEVYGKTHSQVATALNNLGAAWDDLGQHHKAIDYFQQALHINETAFGKKHPDIALDLNNLGATYCTLGDYTKAIDYYQQALDIFTEVYGETHPQVATALNNLGLAWGDFGQHHKAIDYYQKALEITETVFGKKHPDVAIRLNNLGTTYCTLGDYPKAIDYLQRTLDIFTQVYGETHPQVATALNNLGMAWDNLGQHHKAIEYYQQALHIDETAFGKKHPDVAINLNNLGLIYNTLGDYTKAIHYFQQTLDIFTEVYGETHPQVATALSNLGLAWDDLGQHHKAAAYLEKAYNYFHQSLGPQHPNTKTAYESLNTCKETIGGG